MQVADTAFSYIEVLGLEKENDLNAFLGHIFNSAQVRIVSKQIGRNLSQLRLFTESLLDADNPDLTQHVKCEADAFQGEYAKFCYKVNSVYLRPEVQHLLDRKVLDYAVYDVLEGLSKAGGEVNLFDARGDFMRFQSIIRGLSEVGVLYEEQHYSYLHFGSPFSTKLAAQWAKDKYSSFSWNDKLDLMLFRIRHGLSFKELVINLDRNEKTILDDARQYLYWDTDLYGKDYGRRPDPSGSFNPMTESGNQVQWELYGWGAGNPVVRWITAPVQGLLMYFYQYPHKYLGESRDYLNKGLGRFPIGQKAVEYWDDKYNYHSLLPQHGRENKTYYTSREKQRAVLKSVYMAENPHSFAGVIKWRHVRRYLRDARQSLRKYG